MSAEDQIRNMLDRARRFADDEPKGIITVKELAAILSVSVSGALKVIQSSNFGSYIQRKGKRGTISIPLSAVQEYIIHNYEVK